MSSDKGSTPSSTLPSERSVPDWAKPARTTIKKFSQKQPTGSDKKLSNAQLCAKHLFIYRGVHWNGTKWQGSWVCKNKSCRGEVKLQQGSGFTNLVNHVITKKCLGRDGFNRFCTQIRQSTDETALPDNYQSYTEKDDSVFIWLQCIIDKSLPFSMVQDKFWRKHLAVGETISLNTVRQYIDNLVTVVRGRIKQRLPNKFGLILDGWSKFNSHYIAIFATYMTAKGELETPLLSMRPLQKCERDDDTFGYHAECTRFRASDHALHIKAMLRNLYDKSVTRNVTHIGGDHASVNVKLAQELGKPLVGCRSHRQSLELNRLFNHRPNLKRALQTCHKVMRRTSKTSLSAHLRNHTHLRPKMWNKTRWRGKFLTVEQYLKMEGEFQKMPELEGLLVRDTIESEGDDDNELSDSDDDAAPATKFKRCNRKEFETVCELLGDQDQVCRSLQRKDITLADADLDIKAAREFISKTVPDWQCHQMSDDYTRIQVNPLSDGFETAVKKLQVGTKELNDIDKSFVEILLKHDATATATDNSSESSSDANTREISPRKRKRLEFTQALKARRSEVARRLSAGKAKDVTPNSEYIDTRFILGTSVIVEQFFSQCKYILTDQRGSMTPFMFECLVLLKSNRKLWNKFEVAQAIRMGTAVSSKEEAEDYERNASAIQEELNENRERTS